VRAGIERLSARGAVVTVRVNAVATGLTAEDVDAIVCPGLSSVMLPKAERIEDIRKVDAWIELCERKAGIPVGTIRIIVMPETARGIRDAYELATACERVGNLVGALSGRSGDLVRSLGFQPTRVGVETLYIESHILLAARAAGMKWIELPQASMAAALEAHRFDLCQLNEPFYTAAVEAGKVRRLNPGYSMAEIADHYVTTNYFSHRDFAAKNPQLVRNFARVTYEAAAYTNAHHDETAQMMADVTKLPVEVFRKMSRPPGATNGNPALLQPVIDMAAKYGNIQRAFPAKDAYFGAA
jgi:hypothetical protein